MGAFASMFTIILVSTVLYDCDIYSISYYHKNNSKAIVAISGSKDKSEIKIDKSLIDKFHYRNVFFWIGCSKYCSVFRLFYWNFMLKRYIYHSNNQFLELIYVNFFYILSIMYCSGIDFLTLS
jgi:hypothetical protein